MIGSRNGGVRPWAVVLVTVAACGCVLASPPRAVLAQAGPRAGGTAPLEASAALAPDTVFDPSGRPRLVVLRAPGSRVVTLRASVRLREGPTEAGAARALVDLAVSRARSLAGPVSARIEGYRTSSGASYSVTGAAADFDYLAYLLRLLLSEPQPSRIDFQRAVNRLVAEARRGGETPAGRVVRELRARAFPDVPPLDGNVASLPGLSPSVLRRVWARSHGTTALTVIVSGDVPAELILASIQGVGTPEPDPGGASTDPAPRAPDADAQILRRWYGEARVLPDARDPRGQVAALLVSGHMRRVTAEFESHVQLWEMDGRRALAVYGAAYRARQSRMRSRVSEALRETSAGLTDAAVEAAVAEVRRELLFDARTPWGRAAVVDRHLGLGAGPDGARVYVDDLDRVTTASMREYLEGLAALTPVQAQVTP